MSEEVVSQTQFNSLRRDVKEIKNALLGNSEFGQKGYLHRLEKVEDEQDSMKNEIEELHDFKQQLIWWTAGAAAVATLVIQVAFNYYA
jgi:hypothetical protein